jgi:arylsulfatase A-like enzyme
VARWIGQPGPALSYAGSLAGRALYVVRRRRDRPLFLWVHFMDPHTPYRFAGELDAVKDLPEELEWDLRVIPGRSLLSRHARLRSPEGRELLRGAYRNEIARVDEAIGAILNGLASARHRRDRVVTLTSDHGVEFFEHGGFENGHDFFQEVVHVPLVVSGLPGQRASQLGGEESTVVGHIDLAPTLLAAAGIPDVELAGRDLAQTLEPRMLVSQWLLNAGDDAYAVREGDWKLVVDRSGRARLYALETDPGEQEDVSAQHPDVVARLSTAPRVTVSDTGMEALVDEAMRRALRSLGHLDAAPE